MAHVIETSLVVHDRGSGAVRGLRREVRGLDRDARQAGASLDRMAGVGNAAGMERDARAASDYAGALGEVKRAMAGAGPAFQKHDAWLGRVERSTNKARVATDRLVTSMEALGAIDVRPRVEIDGITQARVELAALRAEMRAFGASSASASVGVSGSRGSSGGGMMRLRSPAVMGAATAVGLPAVQSLGVGAAAGLGSAGAGALGVGAVGGSGLAVMTAGLATYMAIAKPAKVAMEEGTKAQEAWTDAVRDFGVGSREAKAAKEEFDRSLADNPGMRQALRDTKEFNREWKEATKAGRGDYFGMRSDRAKAGSRMSGFLGGISNRTMGAVRDAQQSQIKTLTSPQAMSNIDRFARVFVHDLPIAERTLGNLEMTVMNVARAALPFFHEGALWVERSTEGWEKSSENIGEVRKDIGGLVDDARDWGKLIGAAGELLAEVGNQGRPAGGSMVRDLTDTFDRWDAWLENNPEQVGEYFDDAVDSVEKMADGVAGIVHFLNEMSDILRPVLNQFSTLAGIAGSLGLATPGAGALLLGGLRGGRRGRPGAGGAAGGGAGGGMGPVIVTGGAVGAGGLRGGRGAYGAARGLGMSRGAALGEGFSAMTGATATSTTAAGRGAGMFGAGARGAAKGFWPIAAGMGALDFIGADGDVMQRGQSALSTSTLGLLDRGTTRAEAKDVGGQRAQGFLKRNVDKLPQTIAGSQTGMDRIDAELERLGGFTKRGKLGGLANAGNNIGSLGGDWGLSKAQKNDAFGLDRSSWEDIQQRIKLLKNERDAIADTNKELGKSLEGRKTDASASKGEQLSGEFQDAFGIRAGTMGPEAAMDKTLGNVYTKMRQMRGTGAKILGENTLAWAQEMADKNPALQDEVDDLAGNIERKFARMGRRVQVVNGRILTGSKTEWKGIADAIGGQAERALQEAGTAFTDLQEMAVGSLQSMGFSKSDATKLVAASERGGKEGAVADRITSGGGSIEGLTQAQTGTRSTPGSNQRQPMGYRPPGSGDGIGYDPHDHRGDGMGNNGRSQVAAQQKNATTTAAPATGGGNLMGANAGLGVYADAAAGFGLRVSSGLRPGAITSSGNQSMHSTGNAIDLAGSPSQMMAFAQHAASNWGSHLEELIYTPFGKGQIKNGSPYVFTGAVAADHYDHVHIADTAPSGALGAGTGAMPLSMDTNGPGMQISLQAPQSSLGGAPGAMSNAVTGVLAAGLQQKINEALSGSGATPGVPGGGGTPYSGGGTMSKDQIAQLAQQIGFPDPNLAAAIFMAESGGRVGVINSIGATGLAQILQSAHPSYDPGRLASDPLYNLQAAYDISSGGTNWQPWEAYTKGMHQQYMGDGIGFDGVGGNIAWGGWHKNGLDATFSQPTIIGVGEGVTPERVQVTPQHAGGSVSFTIAPGAVQVTAGSSGSHAVIEQIVKKKLEQMAESVAELLESSGQELMV